MDATTIQVRLDKKTKSQAQKVFKVLDISMSEAIKLFLRQVALQRGIPFELKLPNEATLHAVGQLDSGKGVTFNSADELFEDLEN